MVFDLLFFNVKLIDVSNDQRPAADRSLAAQAQPDSMMARGTHSLRGVWVAIVALAALLVSAFTCLALLATHAPLPAVIGAPGAIFLGAIGAGVNVVKFLTE